MMRTVVPTGGNEKVLLGLASADFSAAEVECVAVALADDAGDVADDDVEDVAGPELDDEAVLWVAVPEEAAPVVEVELDDPPHAVSSSSSEPSPVATVHPLLRIASPGSAWTSRTPRDVFL